MLLSFVRAIILYLIVLFVMRFMGKREIGQLEPFELTISMMIADLACTPMANTGLPIYLGIIPIFGLLVMHFIISFASIRSIKLREFFSGKPSILIKNGRIDEKILVKENFTVNELQERLRGQSIFDIGDVEYAILETSGELTVILKPEKRAPTLEDLGLKAEYTGLPYDLVIDGVILKDNLEKIGKNINWLEHEVRKFGFKPEEALVVTLNGKGDMFCQKKET